MRRAAMITATLAVTCVMSACGAAGTGPSTGQQAEPEGQHSMADGTVMDGESHDHGEDHDTGDQDGSAAGPSAAAEMICTGQVVDDVTRIMDLSEPATPTSAWQQPTFTCRFDLTAGPLVLTVHDAEDEVAGMAYFQTQRTSSSDATPLKGVYSLGLPAYETGGGTVSFVKDGKTLEVDASALAGNRLGVDGSSTRTEIAYAVATSVLACWTAHG